jgi:serine/threonine protein kinase
MILLKRSIENRAKFLIVLNKYMSVENFLKPLGIGGYGVVYKDRYGGLDVAVKISLHAMTNEIEMMERLANLGRRDILKYVNYFTLDMKAVKEYTEYQKYKSKYEKILDHYQHEIAKVYIQKKSDLEKATKFYILITEYVEGVSLFDAIYFDRKFDTRKVFRNILNAVKACHDIGIFHLDLKLENIMLKRDGSIVLIDFGLAQQNIEEGLSPTCYNVLGTKEYMPKIVAQSEGINSVVCYSVDVYSLGCILYIIIFKKMYDHKKIESITSPSLRKLISGMTNEQEQSRLTMHQVMESLWLRPVYVYMLPLSTKWWTLSRINRRIPYKVEHKYDSEISIMNYLTENLRDMVADEKSDITFPTLLILDYDITKDGHKYLYGATFEELDEKMIEIIQNRNVHVLFRKLSKGQRRYKNKNSPSLKNRKSVNRSRRKHK